MIKIMIVDDMPVDREYLRNFIDWNAYGFEACCEAKDGKEALALYEKYQPDIILTDIIMPHMDGLELSEAILRENPEAAIILITGNSEFEYARKAVKLGVCDYIVKPFEKEELIITLLKLQDNINRVLEHQAEIDEVREEGNLQSLRQLIYSRNTSSASHHLTSLRYQYFLVVTIQIHIYENKVEPEEIIKWKQVLTSLLKNMIQLEGDYEVFHDFEGNIVTILNFKSKEAMASYQGYEFKDFIALAKNYIGFEVSIGISDYCIGTRKLRDAYYQTLIALSNRYYEYQSKIYDYKKMIYSEKREFYSTDFVNAINRNLELLDYDAICSLIEQELNRIEEYKSIEFANMIYTSLLSILFSYIVKKGRNIDDVFGKDFHPYSYLNKEISHLEKRKFVCDCYLRAIQYQKEHQDTKSYIIAKEVRRYIEENYSNPDLTIGDLSRELLVNQTYLRRMFKQEYHMTISDYITKIRMEKAKDMIQHKNCKLSYVAYAVGYNDTSYFSKCFKKYYGYLPSTIIYKQ